MLTIRITVSVDDPLVRDLIAVRSRTLGSVCREIPGGLVVSGDDDPDDAATGTVAVIAAVDAESIELCAREEALGVLTFASPAPLLDLALMRTDRVGLIVDPGIAARLARRITRAEPLGAGTGLTERELGVVALMAQGLALKQIAVRLGISVKTVENHTTRIYAKLGVRNRREAVAKLAAPESAVAAGPAPEVP